MVWPEKIIYKYVLHISDIIYNLKSRHGSIPLRIPSQVFDCSCNDFKGRRRRCKCLAKTAVEWIVVSFFCNTWDIHVWSLMHISSNIYTTIQIYLHSTLNMSVSFYIYMARCASYRAKQPIFSKGDLRFASWCWSELLPSSIDLQDHHIWYSFSWCVMILKVYEIHIWYVRIDPLFHPISILNIDTS